jgi:hypothetical protein
MINRISQKFCATPLTSSLANLSAKRDSNGPIYTGATIGVGWIKCRQPDPYKVRAQNKAEQKTPDTDCANHCTGLLYGLEGDQNPL